MICHIFDFLPHKQKEKETTIKEEFSELREYRICPHLGYKWKVQVLGFNSPGFKTWLNVSEKAYFDCSGGITNRLLVVPTYEHEIRRGVVGEYPTYSKIFTKVFSTEEEAEKFIINQMKNDQESENRRLLHKAHMKIPPRIFP